MQSAVHLYELRGDRRSQRQRIFLRDGAHCFYCGVPLTFGKTLTLDHVVPRAAGGATEDSNLVSCCLPCNQNKGDRPVLWWALRRGLDVDHIASKLDSIQ